MSIHNKYYWLNMYDLTQDEMRKYPKWPYIPNKHIHFRKKLPKFIQNLALFIPTNISVHEPKLSLLDTRDLGK